MTPDERAAWKARNDDLTRRLEQRIAHHEARLAAAGRPVDKSKDLDTRLRERIARGPA